MSDYEGPRGTEPMSAASLPSELSQLPLLSLNYRRQVLDGGGDGLGVYWSWEQGQEFPRFVLCPACRVYRCSQWGNWVSVGLHSCGRGLIPVLRGVGPPSDFRPDLDPLEALAALARDPGFATRQEQE